MPFTCISCRLVLYEATCDKGMCLMSFVRTCLSEVLILSYSSGQQRNKQLASLCCKYNVIHLLFSKVCTLHAIKQAFNKNLQSFVLKISFKLKKG